MISRHFALLRTWIAAGPGTLALLLLAAAPRINAAVNTYTEQAAFEAAAGPVRAFNFNAWPPPMGPSVPVNPASPGGLQYMGYDGVCFQNVYNHYGLFIYTFPGAIIRADLPAGTYAAGVDVGVFYGWSPLSSEFTITVSTGSGVQTFTMQRGTSTFFGLTSTTPITWITVTHPLEYHLFTGFRLTASAGSVAGCPLPADAAGPISSNVIADSSPSRVNSPIAVTADVSDATTGGANVSSAEYSLGGGPFTAMTGTFNTSHTVSASANIAGVAAAGVYDLCVRGTDAIGNVGAPACTPLVVYDPSAGFVTGGGWIQSPAGAYTADPSLQGKATFGFVSKYSPGASVPSGNTQFQFHAASMEFRSIAYDWLVVSGARAQYKGTGALNGQAGYSFMLTAIDGQQSGGAGVDRFRLKVWGPNGIAYDNQLNAPDSDDPTTAIGGGSIVIHKQ